MRSTLILFLLFFIISLLFYPSTCFHGLQHTTGARKYTLFPYVTPKTNTNRLHAESLRINFDELKNDKKEFLQVLKRRAKQYPLEPLNSQEKKGLNELLSKHLHNIDASSLSSLVFSMGMIGNFNNGEGKLCLQKITVICDQLTCYEMANILLGLGRLNVEWYSIPEKEKIISRLSKLLYNMDEKSISDTIYSLGLLNAKWSKLTPPLQSALLGAFSKFIPKLNSFSLSSILWSFAKIGMKWTNLSVELQNSLPARLLSQNKDFSPQQSSKTIWALGTMGANYRNLPDGFLDFHIENVNKIKRSKMGFAVPASQTLTGIAKTGLPWEYCSGRMRTSLWEQLMRVTQSTNDKGIANAIWAMGTIGTPLNMQPIPVKETMFDAILRISNECGAWGLCNILWGLSKMGCEWIDIPPTLQVAFMTNIQRIEGEMNALDSGILIFSLGNLKAPLDTLPKEFIESLYVSTERNMYEMRGQELSNVIWGLSQSGLSWNNFPFKIQWGINAALRRLGPTMSVQDLAHCAYGISMLAFDATNSEEPAFRGCHQTLLTSIKIALKTTKNLKAENLLEELEQLRIFAQYLSVFKFVSGTEEIPNVLLEVSDLDASTNQKSRLQGRVLQGLEDAFVSLADNLDPTAYEVAPETSSFAGVFPVDASVRYRGKDVAFLEVDGPSHYRSDGKLKRKDKLKESMYRRKHPHASFHRIRYDSENKIGADVIGLEIAEIIMKSASRSNPIDAWFKDLTADVKLILDKSFMWGLRNSPTTKKGDL